MAGRRPLRAMTVFDPLRTASVAMDIMAVGVSGADAVAARQRSRLARLREVAVERSAFYGRQHRGLAKAPLHELPVVRKADLMRAFGEWVTDPQLDLSALQRFLADPSRVAEPFTGEYLVWESSGSGGEPGVFVQDSAVMAVYDALESLRRSSPRPLQRWLDPWYLGERSAFVGAIEGHFASYVTLERLRRIQPLLAPTMHSFSILQPIDALEKQLHDWVPSVLATYPTAAVLLAEESQQGRLRLPLREVWTGGETLTPAMRQCIERGLACTVRNSYGASEFLPIAWECASGRLHVNADWVILESVDEQHRPMPAGQVGATTLLTNLANHVQPLIRYDLGDRIRFDVDPCPCGSALPTVDVQGRCDDTIVLRGAADRAVHLLPLALTTVLEEQASLYDFQLVQQDARTLVLRVPDSRARGAAAVERGCATLQRFVSDQGAQGVRVVGETGCAITPGRTGKVRRIVASGTRAEGTPAGRSRQRAKG
jgi:phenylacetate-coenzyme A ligase PaaK-like adenylate-forming protein